MRGEGFSEIGGSGTEDLPVMSQSSNDVFVLTPAQDRITLPSSNLGYDFTQPVKVSVRVKLSPAHLEAFPAVSCAPQQLAGTSSQLDCAGHEDEE
eukprot:761331-Hanusia_phi.AAC.2